jgi:tol-pal system protein YbgF
MLQAIPGIEHRFQEALIDARAACSAFFAGARCRAYTVFVLGHRTAGIVLALLTTGGCRGSSEVRSPDDALEERVAELRAERRRDQIRLREMEERMALLAAREQAERDRPELPVERVEPEAAPPAIEVVGVEPDGTEIVYVGEAAQDHSVEAPTDLLRQRSSPPPPAPVRRRPPPAVERSGPGGDLGVSRARIPKVGEVTRSHPPAQAREPAPELAPRPRAAAARTGSKVVAEYQRLVAALRAGRHDEAIAGLRRFVARHGKTAYADNAQYWLGEAYYDRKDFARAQREFERVAERFPGGNKVPDALLKAGYCRVALGEIGAAREVLGRLLEEFPGSAPAALARRKLAELGE